MLLYYIDTGTLQEASIGTVRSLLVFLPHLLVQSAPVTAPYTTGIWWFVPGYHMYRQLWNVFFWNGKYRQLSTLLFVWN
jgi:hypothetical protein